MKVKEESEKVGLKLNIQKTKIMASGPITSWQIDGETVKTVRDFFSSVQSLTHVQLFATPWTTVLQTAPSVTNSRSSLRLLSILSVMPSNHTSYKVAKVLEFQLHYQDFQWIFRTYFPLGLTGWTSLQSKGLSRVFSNTTVQKHQFFGAQFFFSPTLTSIHDYWKNHSFD